MGLWVDATVWGFFGLLVGSFLNVVIYRLPKMMERQWQLESAQAQDVEEAAPLPPFNLMVPRSACQQCGHQIRWYQNIPVASYLVLKGLCGNCHTPIGMRYPAVEVLTGTLFALVAYRWGFSVATLIWSVFAACLIALAFIDWDTTLLPDDITLPLLWGGLIAAAMRWNTLPLESAIWGTVLGYMSLWSVYWVFKLTTGKEGMGYGDFKLFAALGAWFGWQALIPIILIASLLGVVGGLGMKFASQLREGGYVPFGPFLAFAGLCLMLTGSQAPLRWLGL